MNQFGMAQSIPRVEDSRLSQGNGRYTSEKHGKRRGIGLARCQEATMGADTGRAEKKAAADALEAA